MCLLQPLLHQTLPLTLCLRRVFPCDIALQIFQQMLAGGLELIADQSQPQKPGTEGVLFIFRVGPGAHRPLLYQRLMGNCQTQLDVAFDLPGVEGGIEHPKLNGSLAEHAVQIQRVIPGVVVMDIPPGIAVVPQGLKLSHGLGVLQVHILQKTQVCLLTIALPVDLHIQRLVQQILLGRHDIDDVAQGLGIVPGRVHVDVDSAAVVYSGSAPAQLPHQLLDRLDVLILADGRYHLHRVQAAGCPLPPGLTLDTGVGNHLPFPSGVILHRIGVVGTAYMNSRRMKMSGNDSGRRAPGDARHFDLNTKVLISQAGSPPPGALRQTPIPPQSSYNPRKTGVFT